MTPLFLRKRVECLLLLALLLLFLLLLLLLLLVVVVNVPFEVEEECPRRIDRSTFMEPSDDGTVELEDGSEELNDSDGAGEFISCKTSATHVSTSVRGTW